MGSAGNQEDHPLIPRSVIVGRLTAGIIPGRLSGEEDSPGPPEGEEEEEPPGPSFSAVSPDVSPLGRVVLLLASLGVPEEEEEPPVGSVLPSSVS